VAGLNKKMSGWTKTWYRAAVIVGEFFIIKNLIPILRGLAFCIKKTTKINWVYIGSLLAQNKAMLALRFKWFIKNIIASAQSFLLLTSRIVTANLAVSSFGVAIAAIVGWEFGSWAVKNFSWVDAISTKLAEFIILLTKVINLIPGVNIGGIGTFGNDKKNDTNAARSSQIGSIMSRNKDRKVKGIFNKMDASEERVKDILKNKKPPMKLPPMKAPPMRRPLIPGRLSPGVAQRVEDFIPPNIKITAPGNGTGSIDRYGGLIVSKLDALILATKEQVEKQNRLQSIDTGTSSL